MTLDIPIGSPHHAGDETDFSTASLGISIMNKADRECRLLELWLQRPQGERTMNDLLAFSGWVQQNHAYLFYGMRGDPYQSLKSVLRGHVRE